MKTIIVKATSQDREKLITFIKKLEKYTDRQIKDAVICTRYLNTDNYNSYTNSRSTKIYNTSSKCPNIAYTLKSRYTKSEAKHQAKRKQIIS